LLTALVAGPDLRPMVLATGRTFSDSQKLRLTYCMTIIIYQIR
jgi:hypothetical protein